MVSVISTVTKITDKKKVEKGLQEKRNKFIHRVCDLQMPLLQFLTILVN